MLIDYDRVGKENLGRQNFTSEDLGKFKSQVLAHRLARQFGRQIGYSVYPYDPHMVAGSMGQGFVREFTPGLILGCVDNPMARKMLSFGQRYHVWWMDAGNGNNSGQILLGNAKDTEILTHSFCENCQTVHYLPMPTVQLPSLLAPITVEKDTRLNCAEAVEAEEQSPVINQVMASLMLEMVRKFLTGTLTWMGLYVDMDAGTFHAVEAEPDAVTRMIGIGREKLLANDCGDCSTQHTRPAGHLRQATEEDLAGVWEL